MLFGLSNGQHSIKPDVYLDTENRFSKEANVLVTHDSDARRQLSVCMENLFHNADGNHQDTGHPGSDWIGDRCDLEIVPNGYSPGFQAFKVNNRFDFNAGMSQYFVDERLNCLVEGDDATLSLKIKLEDEFGNPFACVGSEWNQPTSCPLASLRIERTDGSSTWFNLNNQYNYHADGGWKANEWNVYTALFTISDDLANAASMYFTLRGVAQSNSVIVSDPMLILHGSFTDTPTSDPTRAPTPATLAPTSDPTSAPLPATLAPTKDPTRAPTTETSDLTSAPTSTPTKDPTRAPTTETSDPTSAPTSTPTAFELTGADVGQPTSSPIATNETNITTSSPTSDLGCDIDIINGDFEDVSLFPGLWTVHSGGTLSLYTVPGSYPGNLYAMKLSDRNSPHDGPKHPFNVACFETGKVFEFSAWIQMTTSENTSYGCDPLAGPSSECPILTLEIVYDDGHHYYSYHNNKVQSAWNADSSNQFIAFIDISAGMSLASEAYFYFERPPPDVDLILDFVHVKEYQPVPDENILLEGDDNVYPDCSVIVTNGDAEMGDTSGWTTRLGGHLSIRPEGADQTNFSFQHSARTSFIMGPKHALKNQCFVQGARYAFDAKMKLLDENGDPFECDKTHNWIDEEACPLLTFQLEGENGKSWNYYGNQFLEPWVGDQWNPFNTFFIITDQIADAIEAYFYIERPRAGITLIVDEIVISRDCTELITNSDAENGSLLGWFVMNGAGGYIGIHPEGADGSTKSFGHFDRTFHGGGPGHLVDFGCLVIGRQYEFLAEFKLLDELNNNNPVDCRTDVAWGDPEHCPLLSINLINQEGDQMEGINFPNNIPLTWNATTFNQYSSIITVTEEMANAKSAHILIKGPRAGILTLFDNVFIKLYEPPETDCDHLAPNGDFENGDTAGWHIRQSGSLQVYDDGAEGSSKSLLNVQRTFPGSGIQLDLNSTCLVEGKRYVFDAQMKLLTENGDPFNCTKSSGSHLPDSCPLISIEYENDETVSIMHHNNEYPSLFSSSEWNFYSSTFTISHELASSQSASLYIHGPAPGIGIMIDKVSLDLYEPPVPNCNQLISNNRAEEGNMHSWRVYGGGYISLLQGGYGGSNYTFIQTHRTEPHFGPRQELPESCLKNVGDKFSFNAQIQLMDEEGEFFACDKNAAWRSSLTCPLMTFEIDHPDGIKRLHYGNSHSDAWVNDAWNPYHATVTVTQEMSEGHKVSFFLQGPRPGAQLLFDDITLVPVQV